MLFFYQCSGIMWTIVICVTVTISTTYLFSVVFCVLFVNFLL